MTLLTHLSDIIESARMTFSDVLPSVWAEKRRDMPQGSAIPGKWSYDNSPYTREPVNRLHPSDPVKIIGYMKSAQGGISAGIIENGIGYIISECPGNIIHTVGHEDLLEPTITRVDSMIDNCQLDHLIRSQSLRKANRKTGDTSKSKQFPGGSYQLFLASKHKSIRGVDMRYGFIDDFEAVKGSSKESGDSEDLIMARFTAFASNMKVFFISTPEQRSTSNILKIYEKGDQRKYFIPCPCCGVFIKLSWDIDIEGTDGKEKAGIYYKTHPNTGHLIPSSVGYICQECAGFFKENNKKQFLMDGFWQPTATAINEMYTSYHSNALYNGVRLYGWAYYAQKYLEAKPPGQPENETKMQAWVNLNMGKPFTPSADAPKATMIQKNKRNYRIGTIPERMSLHDGNGRIVLITCGADLNGIWDDARLDYQVKAYTENGQSYNIMHGSIGTFIPRENTLKVKADRERWTYEEGKPNSVWPEFERILTQDFYTDTDVPRRMIIGMTCIDYGHYKSAVFNFLDRTNAIARGVRGKGEDKYIKYGVSVPKFKPSAERPNDCYMLEVGLYKDDLAYNMNLRWQEGMDKEQPAGFMNFPLSENGLYEYSNFFEHFESETCQVEKDSKGEGLTAIWRKKNANAQNHQWDCCIYGDAGKDIFVYEYAKMLKESKDFKHIDVRSFSWHDYISIINAMG